ncbi:MAG: S-layer homology domain-containing protein [Defluviitaleaceae bacterium]|nr:S-layer homology domain-containing protein [Defluviitaleaceae bacterium]
MIKKKRFFAMLLAFVMCFAIMPLSIIADTSDRVVFDYGAIAIDVSDLADGQYLIRIIAENGMAIGFDEFTVVSGISNGNSTHNWQLPALSDGLFNWILSAVSSGVVGRGEFRVGPPPQPQMPWVDVDYIGGALRIDAGNLDNGEYLIRITRKSDGSVVGFNTITVNDGSIAAYVWNLPSNIVRDETYNWTFGNLETRIGYGEFTPDADITTPTISVSPTSVTINDTSLTATATVGGTAMGGITFGRGSLPAAISLSTLGNTITVTATRPSSGQTDIFGNFPVTVSRGGVQTTLNIVVDLTSLPSEPPTGGGGGGGGVGVAQTLTLTPNNATINDGNLSATVNAGGTVTGNITFTRGNLPAAVDLSVDGNVITITGTRPAAGQPAVEGIFPVRVTRGGVNATLNITVNLTPQAAEVLPVVEITPAHQLFDDVAANAWYHGYVSIVVHHGLFQGIAPRTFAPQQNMTRAMFAQVLANLEGVDLATYAVTPAVFNDVAQAAWYYPAVQWAANAGVIQGIGDGNFAPEDNVTREQMAVMLYRYANMRNIELPQGEAMSFIDQTDISYWAASAVVAIQRAGIVQGHANGRFAPQDTAIRAEVAAIFARFIPMSIE